MKNFFMTPKETTTHANPDWGREHALSTANAISTFLLYFSVPFLAGFFLISCTHYQCSIQQPVHELLIAAEQNDLVTLWLKWTPRPTLMGFGLYFGWVIFQALLFMFLPAQVAYGQRTPAGHLLAYKVNGFRVWVLCHVLFFGLSSTGLGLFPASIIATHWGPLFIAQNVYAYILATFVYIKALYFPSHPNDRKFSGSIVYDFIMGVELNPRLFGDLFDFKLFHNGRPGIVAWTLINASFAAAQVESKGYVSKEMLALNLFHVLYVVDFFWNENWYLRTIDIAHDHFGFQLAWGDSVWLPYMYTLQSHYLLRNHVDLTMPVYVGVWAILIVGYIIFRTANNQKDKVRSADGKCTIWNKPATFIKTRYRTSDGKEHTSLLLTSGFWGWSRQFNYVGDLLMSLAYCMTCGFDHVLPYFYIVYMTILLVHRIERSDARCGSKYGTYWQEYCKAVPYKLVPYIY
jgi:7-dehydrocholesterol reductase